MVNRLYRIPVRYTLFPEWLKEWLNKPLFPPPVPQPIPPVPQPIPPVPQPVPPPFLTISIIKPCRANEKDYKVNNSYF